MKKLHNTKKLLIFAYRFKNKSENKFNKKLKNKEKNQGFNNKKINEYDNTRNQAPFGNAPRKRNVHQQRNANI